jgi:c-di-GMP-binding flagellar brake protein YcgR
MIFKWGKKNCWEFTQCGREPGGSNADEMGVCPAALDSEANGIHGGKNGGRICWAVAGTFCKGERQGSFVDKQLSCMNCEFFRQLKEEEGKSFNLLKPGQEDEDNGALLTERRAIVSVLSQAYKNKILLNVSVDEEPDQFVTTLLGVYPEHNLFVLDELNPEHGHELLLQQKKLHAIGRLNGVELQFSAVLNAAGSKSGTAFYKMDLPEFVYHLQLRKAHRVTLFGDRVPFRAYGGSNQPSLRGYVVDISTGGLGVILEQQASLQRGKVLKTCAITLPGEGDVHFSLELCFVNCNVQRQVTRLGCQFIGMDKAVEGKISKFIADLQRDEAQRQHEG